MNESLVDVPPLPSHAADCGWMQRLPCNCPVHLWEDFAAQTRALAARLAEAERENAELNRQLSDEMEVAALLRDKLAEAERWIAYVRTYATEVAEEANTRAAGSAEQREPKKCPQCAVYEQVVIPSWKREEEQWRQDEVNAIEFRRVLAEELDKRDATIAQLRAWLRDYQPADSAAPKEDAAP